MYQVPKNVPFGGTLQYVSSCPKQPVPNMAFCVEHCEMARKKKIPSELHDYLKYSNRVTASKNDQPQTSEVQETAADCQGINFNNNEAMALISYVSSLRGQNRYFNIVEQPSQPSGCGGLH